MKDLAVPALEAVETDYIKFVPAKYKNTYRYWMTNIKDWCISRQLWWGHQIPAWYLPDGAGFVVAENEEQALLKAIEKTGNPELTLSDLTRDPDCLDTWFSSWLWPISLFNGILDPDNKEFKYYYPTADLVSTYPDIIFFRVAAYDHSRICLCRRQAIQQRILHGNRTRQDRTQDVEDPRQLPDPLDLIDKFR